MAPISISGGASFTNGAPQDYARIELGAKSQEVDAITNGDVHWLNPARKVKLNIDELPFHILPTLLQEGEKFYGELEAINTKTESSEAKSKIPLRVRDLWNEPTLD